MNVVSIVFSIILSVLSVILAGISTWALVVTLRQNRKIIAQNQELFEASTRPYLSIITTCVHIGVPVYYFVLKNHGQSIASIKKFSSDIGLSKIQYRDYDIDPFSGLEGSEIKPGQSVKAAFDYTKARSISDVIHFTVVYSGPCKEYQEIFSVKVNWNSGNVMRKSHTEGKTLEEISSTLQEMYLNSL